MTKLNLRHLTKEEKSSLIGSINYSNLAKMYKQVSSHWRGNSHASIRGH